MIDMICYRRHGHNEGDDPSYTQPILYRKIKEHPSVATLYAERLVREGVLSARRSRRRCARKLSRSGCPMPTMRCSNSAERYEVQELSAVPSEEIGGFCPRTAVNQQVLERVIHGITHFPENFHLHPKLRGFVEKRRDDDRRRTANRLGLRRGAGLRQLVLEGTPVRLSGQDSGRGTFSQRHLAFYDSETGKRYVPLQHISPDQARFDVFDSSLSEYAVLGFEFGYSVADPLTLVMWEAQFGDFANGAQIMIDQFISCGRTEVGTAQRPGDAAAARLRRPGTGAFQRAHRALPDAVRGEQYAGGKLHHAGAILPLSCGGRPARTSKPLVIFTPKWLLRSPKAVSSFDDLTRGFFHEVIGDTLDPSRVRKGCVLQRESLLRSGRRARVEEDR